MNDKKKATRTEHRVVKDDRFAAEAKEVATEGRNKACTPEELDKYYKDLEAGLPADIQNPETL